MQLHLRIYGQVQGVFFRYSAKDQAEKLGLTGWVRNNSGGSVEAVAEGPKAALEEFAKWCKKGPSGAQIERVEVKWNKRIEGFSNFEILG